MVFYNNIMSQQVEKTITWLLRHGAVEEKVPMNEEGFVEIINLIQWLKKKNINLKLDDINKIVAADKKSRYLLKDNMIRANQGHSIKLNISMDKFEQNNSQLVHATYYENSRYYENDTHIGMLFLCTTKKHIYCNAVGGPFASVSC